MTKKDQRQREWWHKSPTIDFLVISAHSRHNEEGVSGLDVGRGFWLPSSSLKVQPVIILSACHVANKGRGNYAINDAFLNAGALTILGTLIPVDIVENAALTQRLFLYISETLEGHHDCIDIADAWKRVVNMNISFSILNWTKKLSKWSFEKKMENKVPYEEYFDKLVEEGEKPGELHFQTVSMLKEIVSKLEMKK